MNPCPMLPPYRDQRMAPRIADILEQNGYYCLYLSAGWYRTNFPKMRWDAPIKLRSGHVLCMPALTALDHFGGAIEEIKQQYRKVSENT